MTFFLSQATYYIKSPHNGPPISTIPQAARFTSSPLVSPCPNNSKHSHTNISTKPSLHAHSLIPSDPPGILPAQQTNVQERKQKTKHKQQMQKRHRSIRFALQQRHTTTQHKLSEVK
ncbi:hypothetical protein DL95DRAFT_14993 [Leptodontidium sp. 2 PMI_412]|nr:hypothetical protein DL95DRAFT_14993 [Leptodontidium sp. 2 PMI_412]